MAYRYGNRQQMELLPQSIEEYVAKDDPVRAYDAFVEVLDLNALGIDLNPNKVGDCGLWQERLNFKILKVLASILNFFACHRYLNILYPEPR